MKGAFEMDAADAAHDGRQRLACDVARFGDDETVIGVLEGLALVYFEAVRGQDTTATGHRIATLGQERGVPAEHRVDEVGLGSGALDTARSLGYEAAGFVGGASPVGGVEGLPEGIEFNNLRSQSWWHLREQMRAGRVAVCIEDEQARRKLQEDLLAPRYRIGRDKRIEVEPKEGRSRTWGIKQRLGRSPDYGDMLAMGVFAEHIQKRLDFARVF